MKNPDTISFSYTDRYQDLASYILTRLDIEDLSYREIYNSHSSMYISHWANRIAQKNGIITGNLLLVNKDSPIYKMTGLSEDSIPLLIETVEVRLVDIPLNTAIIMNDSPHDFFSFYKIKDNIMEINNGVKHNVCNIINSVLRIRLV